jgi:NAD(P)-dependent dehydrogenase (short-subunit alcohol dehydrogenase family)
VVDGVEVTDDAGIARLVAALAGRRVDVLVNNAGILAHESLDDLDVESIRRQFEVNAVAPLRVTRALLPNLGEGSRVAIVTSRMGSIADNGSGGYYGYRMSKAAVNMAGVSLARDLRGRGIAVLLLHPGMVATEMTGGRGIPVQESAANLIARIDSLGLEQSGTFHHADGQPLPW